MQSTFLWRFPPLFNGLIFIVIISVVPSAILCEPPQCLGLPLYWWHENRDINFGDHLSLKLVERIVQNPVQSYERKPVVPGKKLLAIGSILYFARDGDVVWGSGVNGKRPNRKDYNFNHLDIRSVRGPITRAFLKDNFDIDCPEIFGDPGLLIPYFFPEFKKKDFPSYNYIVIPHYSEKKLLPKTDDGIVIDSTDPWDYIIERILDSQFVISSSLHGIIVAEAFGIPARMLRITENEPLLKYQDYYAGTNRSDFEFATSIEEALKMGGERPFECNLRRIYEAFPFEFWPDTDFKPTDEIPESNVAIL